jgi:maltose/moltooligosaccharide transporter
MTKISPGRMITLGVGWFGTQFFWGFHSGSMPLFLRNFTESKFRISLVLSLAGVAGCIVPPIVGYLSDRSLTRFGRRRPFIFLGILGVFISILGLPHVAAFGLVAAISGSMYFFLRIVETPYLSLLPDITPPEQRSTTSGVMNLLGSVGLITCFIISSGIWDKHPTAVFRTVALTSFGAILAAITLIREPKIAPPKKSAEKVSALKYLNGIASEANALKFFIAQFFWWLGFWMVSTFATLFVAEELKISEGKSFLVLLVFSIVATLAMLPLGILGDRLGRKGILSCMIALWAVSEIVVSLSQNLTQALITVGLTAIPFAAVMGIGYAYLLDLIPRDRTAEFVGFSIISVASAQIIGPLGGGKLIDTFGYRSIFPAAAFFMIVGLIILQFIRPVDKPILLRNEG